MTVSLRVVLVMLALSLFALAATGSPVYARLSYLWGFVLATCWLWSKIALRGVEVTRLTQTRRAEVGQILGERFQVQNTGRLPRLWVEVRDRSALPGAQGSRVLTRIGGREGGSYLARTRLVRRGVFPLGPTELRSADPFGLFPVSRTVPAGKSVLVYPLMFEVRAFPSPPGLLPGGEALRRRTHQVTPNAATVRDYAPGDSMNRIHWPSTARRGRLMAKEFELDPLAEVWIVVDAERAVRVKHSSRTLEEAADAFWQPLPQVELPPSTEEYAVSIAASLARYFLRRGRTVGLAYYNQGLDVLPPDRGGRQLGKILEALALLQATGEMSISALATAQAQHLPRGSTVILVTPSVRQDVALTADYLLRRGLRPVIVLLDAASFGGPAGSARLAHTIASLGAPVCRVDRGADLVVALGVVVAAQGMAQLSR
ncbi:MAG: DUF58 domain-containing protein [Anaerolineae bacterium]|nr:DUF58 domain-containing protein [Anaerolineae bacterium]